MLRTLSVSQRTTACLVETDLALTGKRVFEGSRVLGAHRALEAAQQAVGDVRRQDVVHALAQEALGPRRQPLGILRVEIQEHAFGAQHEDPVRQRAEDRPMGGLGLLARRDVLGHREHAPLVVDLEGVCGVEDRHHPAILGAPVHFPGGDPPPRLELCCHARALLGVDPESELVGVAADKLFTCVP